MRKQTITAETATVASTIAPWAARLYLVASDDERRWLAVESHNDGDALELNVAEAGDDPRRVRSWEDVDLYHPDGSHLTDAQRVDALREYREHGAMADVYMVDPDREDACEAGPEPWEIDWRGFGE